MRRQNIYSSKNVVALITIFLIDFWLLYALVSHIHESGKIDQQINAIREQTEKEKAEMKKLERYYAYLQTPQRIDKDAKIQLGKSQIGEKNLVLINEKIDILPTKTEQIRAQRIIQPDVPNIKKWQWVFLGQNR